MRRPMPKKLPKLAPEALNLGRLIRHLYQGKFYDEPGPCPRCSSNEHVRYDSARKLFAKVITENGIEDVHVMLKRYKCKRCNHVFPSNAPFYKGCAYATSVVDFCLSLVAKNPYNRVESILAGFGIQVDRDTVKNYSKRFKQRASKAAGIEIFGVNAGVNMLKLFFGVENVEELKRKFPSEKYDAVADETYPAKKGAKKKLKEENMNRKFERKPALRHPEGFCLPSSYLASLKLFVSLLCSSSDFNFLLAAALFKPLAGRDYALTDGDPAYNGLAEERCILHKAKNIAKKDSILKEIKRFKPPDDVRKYLKGVYRRLRESLVQKMAEKYPLFVQDGLFTGAVNTNAIEGGNWRLKFDLRVPYENAESMFSRALLLAISDSMYTFRHGKPCESFAHAHSNFSFSQVMSA